MDERGSGENIRYYGGMEPPAPKRPSKIIALLLALIFPAVYLVAEVVVTFVVMFAQTFSLALVNGGDVGAVQAQAVESMSGMLPVIMTVYCALTIVSALVGVKLCHGKIFRDMGFGRPDILAVILALFLGVAMNLVTSFLMELLPIPQEMLDSYNEGVGEALSDTSPLMIFCVALLVPVTEEIAFRCMPMRSLRRAYPAWAAVLITGAVFALVHIEPLQMLYVLPTGLLLGLVFVWCGAGASIAMHIGYNGLSALALLLSAGAETEAAELTSLERLALVPMTAVFAAIAALLVWGLACRRGRHVRA